VISFEAEEYAHLASTQNYNNISFTLINQEENHKVDNEKSRLVVNSFIFNTEKGHMVDAIHSPMVNIATKTSEKTPLIPNARQ